ncbi:hypothetical protein DFH09DRAFT_1077074 [Mycena vulgaris]|nr:hypothetical protein DFH09DRAFT_1077074 [Mycena vulgaris]
MSRYSGIPRRTSVTVVCFVLVLFLAPTLQSFPDAAPLIIAFTWAGDKFMQGLTSLALIISAYTFSSLARDGHRWLTNAPDVTPTPAKLEDGTAPRSHASAEGDDVTAGAPSGRAPILKVVRAAGTLTFFYSQIFRREIVSLQSPLLENVGATLLFLWRRLEVLLVEFLLLLFTALEAAARAATGPVEVLFDEGTGPKEKGAITTEQKGSAEVEPT